MYRYLALTWDVNSSDPGQTHAVASLQARLQMSSGWEIVLAAPGIYLVQKHGLGSACRSCVLPDFSGAVVGTLFSWPIAGQITSRLLALRNEDGRQIVKTKGRHLVENYWGRYVAFIRSDGTNRYLALRDPTGGLPCFTASHQGTQIWFSHIEDYFGLGVTNVSLNWHYVESHVAFRMVQSHETGLNGIREIQPGDCCEVNSGVVNQSTYWDPARVSETDVLENSETAATTLRAVTKACIDAWASCYDGILHTLSGGLDSSIVLAALSQAPRAPKITCLNYSTEEPEGDERVYARLVANRAGCTLVEKRREPQAIRLSSVLNVAASPKPWPYLYHIEHEEYEALLARDHGATSIFSGGGGDGLFYQTRVGYSVADYIQRHGITPHLMTVALDAARLSGKSLAATLLIAIAHQRRWPVRKFRMEQGKFRTLVNEDVIISHSSAIGPSFEKAIQSGIPLGKLWQILSVSIPPAFYAPFSSPLAIERVPPLVSQPIIEVCLRTPSYVLVENGWDRAMARRAFAADLPPNVVNRRGKGGLRNHVHSIFNANINFLRELLLDGELVRHGILNRARLESCLTEKQSLTGTEFAEIQDHVSTEAWVARLNGINHTRAVA